MSATASFEAFCSECDGYRPHRNQVSPEATTYFCSECGSSETNFDEPGDPVKKLNQDFPDLAPITNALVQLNKVKDILAKWNAYSTPCSDDWAAWSDECMMEIEEILSDG